MGGRVRAFFLLAESIYLTWPHHHLTVMGGIIRSRPLVAINRTSVPQLAETPILVWQAGWRKNPVIICLSDCPIVFIHAGL